jgi:small redox-active disulfide protein 2
VKIEILGTGCPKCQKLEKNVAEAIIELGIEAEIVKVTDIIEIANRGAAVTPALSVDGEIRIVGRVPTIDELKAMLASQENSLMT